MKQLFLFTCLLLTLFYGVTLTGCTTHSISSSSKAELKEKEVVRWEYMLGKWYGKQAIVDGGVHEFSVERFADGTYVITFKRTDINGDVEISQEVGYWGISGDVYFSIFKGWLEGDTVYPSNPSDPYNYDAYHILELSQDYFKYRSASSDNIFTIKRVPDDFQLMP